MPKICVLVCTFERPVLLHQLLLALVGQAVLHGATTIVVDNGINSSEGVVSPFMASMDMDIVYDRIANRGLVSARNRAMSLALSLHPEFLAIIDDDEVPGADWLSNLIQRAEETGADIIGGPVMPQFEISPPQWLLTGAFFSKSGDPPGTENLLIRASCLPQNENEWFQHVFNFTGGEDLEFIARLQANGARSAVAPEAIVMEHVPQSRMKRSYIWRRGLRDGVAIAQIAALGSQTRAGFAALALAKAGAKFGYGLNHLFWSPGAPWRLHRAMADFASALGIILRALGVKFKFYGQAETAQDLFRVNR